MVLWLWLYGYGPMAMAPWLWPYGYGSMAIGPPAMALWLWPYGYGPMAMPVELLSKKQNMAPPIPMAPCPGRHRKFWPNFYPY